MHGIYYCTVAAIIVFIELINTRPAAGSRITSSSPNRKWEEFKFDNGSMSVPAYQSGVSSVYWAT